MITILIVIFLLLLALGVPVAFSGGIASLVAIILASE